MLCLFPLMAAIEIYTLSLHDALPISRSDRGGSCARPPLYVHATYSGTPTSLPARTEEHTSELQSPYDLVCRLLPAKKVESQSQLTLSRQSSTNYYTMERSSAHTWA